MVREINVKQNKKMTRKVAVGNLGVGGSLSGAILAFFMFGAARYYGGDENIPRDVLQVAPWVTWVLTNVITTMAGSFTKENTPQ